MRPLMFGLFAFAVIPLVAQSNDTIHLVMPHGPGGIIAETLNGFHPSSIALYDQGTRPVLSIVNDKSGVNVSYILFPNNTQAPNAKSCGDAVVNVILNREKSHSKIENEVRANRILKSTGQSTYAVAFYEESMESRPIHQQELFGFFGDKNTCAEIHISKALMKPGDMPLLEAELERFNCDLEYAPSSRDYGALATIYFGAAKDYPSAATYYDAALDTYDDKPMDRYDSVTMRRVLTDQASMAYGMSGDLAKSRAINEAAIARDPLYPLYYYNLACADAEAGNASAARTHLEQAYARRANTLKGETLPDASKDDSILKLKSNADFWTFVQSLPKN
jgi:tetratricopeptide (TPR) repeat protein